MKKIFLFLAFVLFFSSTFASLEPTKSKAKVNAKSVFFPIGKTGQVISLYDLSKISKADLEKLTGRKMTVTQKLSFYASQRKLRNSIDENGFVKNKKLNKVFTKKAGNPEGFHAVGFILGFLLGLIGVLLAYVINDDEDKKNRTKWAWIGFGAGTILWIVLYVAILSAVVI